MKPFTPGKKIRRTVLVKVGDPSIPDRTWVLEFGEDGIGVRHHGTPSRNTMRLPWRSVIAHTVMTNFGRRTK